MPDARATFAANIRAAREQSSLYDFLVGTVVAPFGFDDILRSQLVYAVSAFDKLIHDLIREGMLATYLGGRVPTDSYLSESISLELHGALSTATLPPPEVIFEQEIVKKLKIASFQDPEKVSKGLSLIWPEKHKWQAIADVMGVPSSTAQITLKLICTRRNAIVHEADIDPLSGLKTPISRAEANTVTDFLENCGNVIADLVA